MESQVITGLRLLATMTRVCGTHILKLIVILLVDITIDIFVLNTILIFVFVGVVISVTIIVPSYAPMSPISRCQDSTVSLVFASQV